MKRPTIPTLRGAAKWVAYVWIALLLVFIATIADHIIPLAWAAPVLILGILGITAYRGYYALRQGCKGYFALQAAACVTVIILVLLLCKYYTL